jgi:hypothetical protein
MVEGCLRALPVSLRTFGGVHIFYSTLCVVNIIRGRRRRAAVKRRRAARTREATERV